MNELDIEISDNSYIESLNLNITNNILKTKELPEEYQRLIKNLDVFVKDKISYYEFEKDNLNKYIGINSKIEIEPKNIKNNNCEEMYKFLIHLGQISLNNGCDLLIYEDNLYKITSHDFDDFLDEDYYEECDYCYDINFVKSLK